jgi:aminocarboxymuconate-semialdehyde decarboxylase
VPGRDGTGRGVTGAATSSGWTPEAPPVVDVHAHTVVPAVAGLVAGHAGLAAELEDQARTFGPASMEHNAELITGAYVPLLSDIPTRFGVMDAGGVDVQAVSIIPTQYHYWADPGLADDVVGAANEHIAALVGAHPDRLVGLATIALQHPGRAAAQLRHAMTTLGLRGVEISTSAAGRDFSDPFFEPFWTEADALGAFVFVHPWGCSLGERLSPFYLGNVIGQPAETTLALSHLVFGGVLDRHPGLRVCGAHGGGYLPYYVGRSDHAWHVRPESRTTLDPPSRYLQRLWFDALVYRADSLRLLVDVAGADRVLLGTDYPFDMSVTDPVERINAVPGLSGAERTAITGGSAAALLGITAPATTPTRPSATARSSL